MLLDNREQQIANPRHAHALGLGMVYQHFTLVPNMTVAENLVLARPQLPAVLDWQRERQALERLLDRCPLPSISTPLCRHWPPEKNRRSKSSSSSTSSADFDPG